MSFAIVTDSSCNLPNEIIDKYDLHIVSLVFMVEGKPYQSYVKGEENDLKRFYTMMRNKNQITTSCANEAACTAVIEPLLKSGQDVLFIGFSSALSGTYQEGAKACEKLRKAYPDRKIIAVDSLCASLGEGLLVTYACQWREKGFDIDATAEWLEDNKLKLCHWFTVDDLMHLHRGGRVSKASAIFGSLLGIKPVLHVDDEGHLILMSKSRGRQGAMEALAAKMKETVNDDVSDQMILISHGDCLEDAEKLKAIVQQVTGARHFMLHTIGTVIGSHSGPGTLALFFLGKHR